jgi:hypothetical protein
MLDDFHFAVDFLLQKIVVLASRLDDFLHFEEFLLCCFDILVVFKLDHSHLDDFFFKFLNILLHLVVDAVTLGDGGGEDFVGSTFCEVVVAIEVLKLPDSTHEIVYHEDLDLRADWSAEDFRQLLTILLLDVVHLL